MGFNGNKLLRFDGNQWQSNVKLMRNWVSRMGSVISCSMLSFKLLSYSSHVIGISSLFLVFQSSVSCIRFGSGRPENAALPQHVISMFPIATEMFLTAIETSISISECPQPANNWLNVKHRLDLNHLNLAIVWLFIVITMKWLALDVLRRVSVISIHMKWQRRWNYSL